MDGQVQNSLRGHNNPPVDSDALPDRLKEDNKDLIARRDQLVDAMSRVPETIEDEQTAQKLTDQIRLMKACAKEADNRRKVAKQPYLDGGKAVDGVFRGIMEPLDRGAGTLTGRLNTYQRKKAEEERKRRAEEERKAREAEEAARKEAERLAAEAADEQDLENAISAEEQAKQAEAEAERARKAAAAKDAELSMTRGEYGATSGLRSRWTFEITGQVDLEALRPYLPQAAVEQAMRGFIKNGGREIKGARIFEDFSTVVR